jgi:hypothetical protein
MESSTRAARSSGHKYWSTRQGGHNVHDRFPPDHHLDPEQFVAGLTDFGPGRSKLFPNSADTELEVHHKGPFEADVTEGGGGTWERLHYNWTDPSRVILTTTDSNVFGGASGYTYTLTRNPNGTTDVDVVIVREGKNLRGRVLALVLGTVGKTVLKKAFVHSVRALEARSATPTNLS